jgi:phospholipase/carboxylesterase
MNEYFQIPQSLNMRICIWLHGLGASGNDMRPIAEAISVENTLIRHVFLDAPLRPVTINQGYVMPAWYDILGMQLTDREDIEGIQASYQLIDKAITSICQNGFTSEQIILAGFSQGAAMALYTALTTKRPLGGVIALSGYLPLSTTIEPIQSTSLPIFMGYGRFDSVVMPAWTQSSIAWLRERNYSALTIEDYPIDHSVCPEEILALSHWLMKLGEGEVT